MDMVVVVKVVKKVLRLIGDGAGDKGVVEGGVKV